MNQYKILLSKVEEANKLIERINKKAGRDICGASWADMVEYQPATHTQAAAAYKTLSINFNYQIPNYEVVAQIDRTSGASENIINLINYDFNEKIPDSFRRSGCTCDHCNTARNRNYLYIIYNTVKKEYKQIGSSCILDYTGINDSIFFNFTYIANQLKNLQDDELKNNINYNYIEAATMKAAAIKEFLKNGYLKDKSEAAARRIHDDISDTIKNHKYFKNIDIKKYDDAAAGVIASNDYLKNALSVYNAKYINVRYIKLVLSFIKYLNDRITEKQQANNNINYVEGQKIQIKLTNIKLLYNNYYTFGRYYTTRTTTSNYTGQDSTGIIYKFKSSKYNDLNTKKEITAAATVEGIKEYNGIKQVILKNLKLISC